MGIENILIAKRDLDTYSTKDLNALAKYYNVDSKSRNDLCWLLSMAILGESHKATMRGMTWAVIEANVFEYDKVLDLIEAIVQLEEHRVDYKLETSNQEPIRRNYRSGWVDGVEADIEDEGDDEYRLLVTNAKENHPWRFIAEFVIKTDELAEGLRTDITAENLSDLLPILRDAEVVSVDSRNMVGGHHGGLRGGNTVILKAVPFTKR